MAVQPDRIRENTRERVLKMVSDAEPFEPVRDTHIYRTDLFESDHELEEFLSEIYSQRRKNLI